jgi:transposase-like protein
MLVELGLVEQRYQAVQEVLDHGASVTDVARRNGVSRQAVHEWLVRYAHHGLSGLVDRSLKLRAALTRWPRWSRRASSSCAGSIPAGAHAPSSTASLERRHRPRARAVLDLSLPDPPRLDHTRGPQAQALRLQGAVPGHGAVADGRGGPASTWPTAPSPRAPGCATANLEAASIIGVDGREFDITLVCLRDGAPR